jgi:hypothetical protein
MGGRPVTRSAPFPLYSVRHAHWGRQRISTLYLAGSWQVAIHALSQEWDVKN